jgi:hypothetical protein
MGRAGHVSRKAGGFRCELNDPPARVGSRECGVGSRGRWACSFVACLSTRRRPVHNLRAPLTALPLQGSRLEVAPGAGQQLVEPGDVDGGRPGRRREIVCRAVDAEEGPLFQRLQSAPARERRRRPRVTGVLAPLHATTGRGFMTTFHLRHRTLTKHLRLVQRSCPWPRLPYPPGPMPRRAPLPLYAGVAGWCMQHGAGFSPQRRIWIPGADGGRDREPTASGVRREGGHYPPGSRSPRTLRLTSRNPRGGSGKCQVSASTRHSPLAPPTTLARR